MATALPDSDYRIKLPVFEGPLDLLLFLIRKSELDIYDIPVAQVTAQYLDYLHLMKEMNVDVASDRKSTRLNSSHMSESRMPSSA